MVLSARAAFAAALATVAATSCATPADLGAVRTYAASAERGRAAMDALADDYAATCREEREFAGVTRLAGAGAVASDPLTARPLEPPFPPRPSSPDAGSAASPATAGPVVAAGAPTDGADAAAVAGDPRCAVATEIARRWHLENDLVVDYAESLGALAGADAEPRAATFGALAVAMARTGGAETDDAVGLGAAMARSLAALALQGRRSRDLGAVVRAANRGDALRRVLASLRADGAGAEYDALRDERGVVDGFFVAEIAPELREIEALRAENGLVRDPPVGAPLRALGGAPAAPPTLAPCPRACVSRAARVAELRAAIDRERVRWSDVAASIARRAASIAPYVAAIDDVARVQAALGDAGAGGPRALAAAVRPFAADLAANVLELEDAYSKR